MNCSRQSDRSVARDPAAPTVLVGAGDIAGCGTSGDDQTANLLDGIDGTVITLGDNAYESGSAQEFTDCYQPSWGRHTARTMPAVGNHEYVTPGAAGYYGYFGAAASPLDQPCIAGCKGSRLVPLPRRLRAPHRLPLPSPTAAYPPRCSNG